MNADIITSLGKGGQKVETNSQTDTGDSRVGRPEKDEREKSDKTIANRESSQA